MSNAIDPREVDSQLETMADGDFERLLGRLSNLEPSGNLGGCESNDTPPVIDRSVLNQTMADTDFDKLLDSHQKSKEDQRSEMSNEEKEPVGSKVASDSITDDEFEALLDELHGPSGMPQSVEVDTQSPSAESVVGDDGHESEDWVELMLDPTMVIAHISVLHERLCSLLDEDEKIGIKAAEVNVIDTANLQLLYAFIRDRRSRGRETLVYKPSETFRQSVKALGMSGCLGLENA